MDSIVRLTREYRGITINVEIDLDSLLPSNYIDAIAGVLSAAQGAADKVLDKKETDEE